MASAQVMRKQEHLEAGKRKLEEFRRKKAAERAKKTAQASQVNASNGDLHDKQLSETGQVRVTDSDGAGTSDSIWGAGKGNDESSNNELMKNNVSPPSDIGVSHSFSSSNHDSKPLGVPLSNLEDKELWSGGASEFANQVNAIHIQQENKENEATAERGQFMASHLPSVQETNSTSSHFSNFGLGLDKALSNNNDIHLEDISITDPDTSYSSVMNISPTNAFSALAQSKLGYTDRFSNSMTTSSYEGPPHSTIPNYFSGIGKSGGAYESSNHPKAESRIASLGEKFGESSSSSWPSDRFPALGFGSTPIAAGNNRKSRPSFLDTINISKGPSASASLTGSERADHFGSKIHPMDLLQSAIGQNSVNAASGNEVSLVKHLVDGAENKHDSYLQKQNEDFAALEQHIEDLTQEKFTLQRALEASRTLAESLAAENSTLTDSYNQQGSIVAQLKSDMESLQEEIKAQLAGLESIKLEYANAQLECNAADERAKLLASEVIVLEEKALRLRSNELKLERELENSQAEISSLKKKMSSLEKERRDLQSTIDALQEEKKLMQSKLRKASASGKSVDASKSAVNKKDVSTSTTDLVDADDAASTTDTVNGTASIGSHASTFLSLNENRQFTLDELSLSVPHEQTRMIQNINTLISELAMEKEELVQALSAEFSQSSKLKELNKELTRKLEAQTQRLELLTAQSMVGENISVKRVDSRNLRDSTTYADEGDEVVERVLGWIMKLFPGGPSRRRTSKLV